MSRGDSPRTLTEALRSLPADALGRLLRHRPDLADPPPRDLAEVAARATTTPSVNRALSRLNAWLATVAEALAVLPDPGSTDELAGLLDQPVALVSGAVEQLREQALVWGEDDQLHLVRPVREAFEPFPGALAPPSPRPLSPDQIDSAVELSGPEGRTVLERLLWSPTGTVRNAARAATANARSPVAQLLSRELLRPLDSDTVIIPREVAWRLRGARLTREPVADRTAGAVRAYPEPDPGRPGRGRGRLRAAARHRAGRRGDRRRSTPAAAERRAGQPRPGRAGPPVGHRRRTGHVPGRVRVRRATGGARTGGAASRPPATTRGLPIPAPARWRLVADAWWAAPRLFARSALAGAHALGPEADHPVAADLRASILDSVSAAGAGTIIDPADLAASLTWHRPRLVSGPLDPAEVAAWTWREATWLGLVALDAVSTFARPCGPARPPVAAGPAGALPGAGRDDHDPGRPDRGGRRPPQPWCRGRSSTAGRPGVPRRRGSVPVQRRFAAAGVRPRLVSG